MMSAPNLIDVGFSLGWLTVDGREVKFMFPCVGSGGEVGGI